MGVFGRPIPHAMEDSRTDAVEIPHHIRRSDPNGLDPTFTKERIPISIPIRTPVVIARIKFNDQRRGVAIEIHHVRPDRMLSAEPKTPELLPPES